MKTMKEKKKRLDQWLVVLLNQRSSYRTKRKELGEIKPFIFDSNCFISQME